MFSQSLRRFVEQAPVGVAVRATVQRLLTPAWLDALFEREAQHQYQAQLLFSTVVELMSQVIDGTRKSIHEAYQHTDNVAVSITSIYNKLNRLEPRISSALVRDSAQQVLGILQHLPLPPALLEGYEIRIVDGNHLAGTEHRIHELRHTRSAALPGQALVVLDPRRKLMLHALPCEDAHAQERSLVPRLLDLVQPGQLWIADRNFCTTAMLFGIAQRQACFLIRQHASTLRWEAAGAWKCRGRCATGKLWEQPVRACDPISGQWMHLRRIKLLLDRPTDSGEQTIYLLSNLPQDAASANAASANAASAGKLAELYLGRWEVEAAFCELTAALVCEIRTLGHPPAALFAFCLALTAYNGVSLVKTALAAVHGQQKVQQEVSFYHLAREVAVIAAGLQVAVRPEDWSVFERMTQAEFAQTLLELAGKMNLRRYRKSKRGPKKKRPPRTSGKRNKHVSTARILAQRKAGSRGP